jgi:hypothetical protein
MILHAHGVERVSHGPVYLSGLLTEILGTESDILVDRRHEELIVRVLKDEPDLASNAAQVAIGNVLTVHSDGPGRGTKHSVSVKDQRGLASAVGSQQGYPLTVPNRQVTSS